MPYNAWLHVPLWAMLSLLLSLPCADARADDGMAFQPLGQDAAEEAAPPLSMDVGVDFVTAYWWRGYLFLSDNVREVNGTDDTEGYLYANIGFAF